MKGERFKMFGGFGAGLVLALAGSFGVAVGMYTLPDPQHTAVDANAYVRADQTAIAAATVPDGPGSTTYLRFEANRGASAGAATNTDGTGQFDPDVDPLVGTWFSAHKQTCDDEGSCGAYGDWSATVSSSQFVFDPLMGSAHFSGAVDGCMFDVTWTGEGLVLPFPARDSHYNAGEAGSDVQTQGREEVSRVAPAHVVSCFGTFDAKGYLSVGSQRDIVHAQTFTTEG